MKTLSVINFYEVLNMLDTLNEKIKHDCTNCNYIFLVLWNIFRHTQNLGLNNNNDVKISNFL